MKTTRKALAFIVVILMITALFSTAVSVSAAQVSDNSIAVVSASNSKNVPKITKSSNTNSGIKLTWNKVKGASKYRVFIKDGSKWKKLADTKSTSYTYKNAKNNKTYKFTVRCISSNGKRYTSSYSKSGYKTTYYSAPKLSKVENTTSGVKVSWKAVKGIDEYRVYVKRAGASGWSNKGKVSGTSYTHTSGVSGRKYVYTVRCVKNGKVCSSFDSKGKSITYVAAPRVDEIENTSKGIKLSWDKVKGASKYRVFIKDGSKWKKLADTKSTGYTYTDVKDNQTYKFTVRCLSSEGKCNSAYVKSGFKSTYYSAPKLSKVENTTSGVKVSWNAVGGIDTYRLYVKANGADNWSKVADVSGTTYTDTSVDSGNNYTYTVRCVKDSKTVSAYKSTRSINYVAAPTISDVTLDNDKLVIKWNAVEGSYKYNVLVKDDDSWKSAGYTTKTNYSYTIDGGKTYTFTVKCCDRNNYAVSAYDNNGYSATVTYIIDQEEHTTEECVYEERTRSICNICGTDISGDINGKVGSLVPEYSEESRVWYHCEIEGCGTSWHTESRWFYVDTEIEVGEEQLVDINNIYLYNENHKDQLEYRYRYSAVCKVDTCEDFNTPLCLEIVKTQDNNIKSEMQAVLDGHAAEHAANGERTDRVVGCRKLVYQIINYPEVGHYELVVK